MSHRFDELASIDTLSIPSIDDEDDMMLYKKYLGEDEELIQLHNLDTKVGSNRKPYQQQKKNIRRREFGEIVEEVIINDDEISSSGSEKYISPRENKYLDEVNELLGKAKAERENSPTKQTTPDTARFLTKIKKSLEDNLDDVIEESTRLLKEALPMFSYETKQGTRENFSDMIKRQQKATAKKEEPSSSSLFTSDFDDDIPMMTISKPINEFPNYSSEYRNYEVFESKKNKKLLDKDHDDISTKFFPHLHETIQRSTPLKNRRLKANVVKTPKVNPDQNNEYYAKSTEILPSNMENRHVYEIDEDPSPNKEEELKKDKPQRQHLDSRQSRFTGPKKQRESVQKTENKIPKNEQKEEPKVVETVPEVIEDKPLIFEYIKPKVREIEFASPSSPVEPFEQVESMEELSVEETSPRVVNMMNQNLNVFHDPVNIQEEQPNQVFNEESQETTDQYEKREEPLTVQSFEEFNFDSNEISPAINEESKLETEETILNKDDEKQEESFYENESPMISRDLDNIGFQDIIRDLNFTTETILRACSSSVVDIEPINIPNFIPQEEDQIAKENTLNHDEPHTPAREQVPIEALIPFSPMIYDQYSPIHNIPSPQSPIETPQPTPPKKKISSNNLNKKKTIATPREHNAPLEESFIPYSGVRHLQKTTYNHSTIDWYLNLCSNKYSRTPSTSQNNTDKGVVKWV
ncbi:predicted protein [Naegleria gruberi]|uniref:Predicted protein n=1 Tax=Naegleria gruberi TaxID=5762 RepID=D2VIR5_NAEGR|nr:uncharacterized protein NAEGRDRAFT_49874 [Naegleria gruberi]EFC43321.1 predicted protein [Naegleria gruberi]|eukprot:XP_002676065.1 predicted protein [Naegleria gruberi strain NEG-M]